ncbi:MAG: VCBS repeat-containing protein [Bacteroidia bacterium]|nr:VCBS repeat-containing protein [Bacteroidia bacterium]
MIWGLVSVAQQRFVLLNSQLTGLDFKNTLPNTPQNNFVNNYFLYSCGGVAAGDFNNDGLIDLFFTAYLDEDALYLNKGNFRFENITKKAGITNVGWSAGVTLVDINNDGYLDIYVCKASEKLAPAFRKNQLFLNNGDLTFTECAQKYGIADSSISVHAAFFDYDRDGDLDLYVVNRPDPKYTSPTDHYTINLIRAHYKKSKLPSNGADKLYQNQDGIFKDVTSQAGIDDDHTFGLSVTIADFNQDNWPDIYVANDFVGLDHLYINNRNGTFTDSLSFYCKHICQTAMGSSAADLNNDGLEDLIVLDMLPFDSYRQKTVIGYPPLMVYEKYCREVPKLVPQYIQNCFYLNTGYGLEDIAFLTGTAQTDWSWAPLLADWNNDGYIDIYVTNGIPKDPNNGDIIVTAKEPDEMKYIARLPTYPISNILYQNYGQLVFRDKTKEWGLYFPMMSAGAVAADLDNDGDLDLVTNNLDSTAVIYKNLTNQLAKTQWVQIQLQGSALNTFGIGAKVVLFSQNRLFCQRLQPAQGYQSSLPPILHFGLPLEAKLDSIWIYWPDGSFQKVAGEKIQVRTLNTISYSPNRKPFNSIASLVAPQPGSLLPFKHVENVFSDFSYDFLLPHKFSCAGPSLAVGDFNKDGREDLLITGSSGNSAQLWLQTELGNFVEQPQASLQRDAQQEDQGCLLADFDKDGNEDAIILSGGNENPYNPGFYEQRFYKNDGLGNFLRLREVLPPLQGNFYCIAAADFDKDSDLDIFIGGFVKAGKYPFAQKSYLLQNHGNKFIDVTQQYLPDSIGMITSALWSDVDNNNELDLVLVGYCMPITIFFQKAGVFERYVVPHSNGLWQSITAADFDNDGDTDYLLGNVGENQLLSASSQKPITIYVADFDKNGKLDPVLFYYVNNKLVPAYSRDWLLSQVPALKQLFPTYDAYGKCTFEHFERANTSNLKQILIIETLANSYLQNEGNGKLILKKLPYLFQIGCMRGVQAIDFNQDGNLDFCAVGNIFESFHEWGKNDGNPGIVGLGDGNNNFEFLLPAQSGFCANKNARALVTLINSSTLKAEPAIFLIVANNNDSLQIFEVLQQKKNYFTQWPANATFAYVTFKEQKTGKIRKRKIERYWGQGYLSQPTSLIFVPKGLFSRIEFYDNNFNLIEEKTIE